MKRWVSLVSLALVCSLLAPMPAHAVGLSFNVKANNEFFVNLFLFGSVQVLLDAAWIKANADLDMLVLCEDDISIVSFSAETRFESLSFGIDGGNDGIACVVGIFSFKGSSKGNLSVRITGTETPTSAPAFAPLAGGEAPPELLEMMQRARAAKGRRARQ